MSEMVRAPASRFWAIIAIQTVAIVVCAFIWGAALRSMFGWFVGGPLGLTTPPIIVFAGVRLTFNALTQRYDPDEEAPADWTYCIRMWVHGIMLPLVTWGQAWVVRIIAERLF